VTRGLAALPALALLAGCGSQEEPNATDSIVFHGNAEELVVPEATPEANLVNAAQAAEPAVNLAPDGLSLVLPTGATRHINFSMPRDLATRAISAARSRKATIRNAAPARFPSPASAAGWASISRAASSPAGTSMAATAVISPPRRASASDRPGSSSNPPTR
jgi:hypothetical protein